MTRIGNLLLITLILVNFSYISHLSAANIRTSVSQEQVMIGEVFDVIVEVSFKSDVQPNLSIYEIPRDPKISFLRQSSGFSVQTVITNGVSDTKKTITLNMTFYAKDKGRVQIPSIKLKINEKIFAAKGFKVEILEKSNQVPQSKNRSGRPSQNSFGGMDSLLKEFFGNSAGNFGKAKDEITGNLDFFIDVETSNMNPYISEQFVATWYLYTNGRVTDIDTLKYPALEGFWKDEISLATSLNAEEVRRNGKVFTRYQLASYALTPIVNNQAFIDPYEVKCQLIGSIFSFGAKELIRKSDEVLMNVKPLPKLKPVNFTGAVGSFQTSSYLEDQVFKVGQPFTYVIRVSGEGQLKFMELPELGLNEDEFTIYDSMDESQFTPPLKSVRIFKILVVPKKTGLLTVPELMLSFFDPKTSEFYNLKTKPININVGKGDKIENDIVSVSEAKQNKPYEPKLFPSASVSDSMDFKMSAIQGFTLCGLGLLMSLSLLLLRFLKLQVSYSFEKDLKQRFEQLEVLISEHKWREASTFAVNIVYFYANAKTKKKPRSQKLEDILSVLPSALRREVEVSIIPLNSDLQKYSFAQIDMISNTEIKDQVLEKCLALKALLERSSIDEVNS